MERQAEREGWQADGEPSRFDVDISGTYVIFNRVKKIALQANVCKMAKLGP